MYLKRKYNLLFLVTTLSIFLFVSNTFAASVLPELKKSINYQCKNDDSYKSIKQCRSDVLGDLSLQGTDFIYRIQDKDIRKDMVLQCNFERKNAIKFNACLFEQVAIFFGEDTTIPPPVIIETEKNSEDDLVSIITEPDKNEISLIERLVKSTFFIEAIDNLDSYDVYTGSAVKINSSDLLTACHVVYDYEKRKFLNNIFISNVDHKDDKKRYTAKVIKHDIKKDACVLSSDEISKYPSVPNTKDFDNLKVYEKVYGIGNPNGFTGRTVEGKIISLYSKTPGYLKFEGDDPFDPVFLIETNAPIDKGNSGGGIYDIEGNLIGIISMCDIVDTTGDPCRLVNPINWSIPASSFKNLTKFNLEDDYYVELQKEEENKKKLQEEEDKKKMQELDLEKKKKEKKKNNKDDVNKWIEKKDNTDFWLYEDNNVISNVNNNPSHFFDLTYLWRNDTCMANMLILHELKDNDEKIYHSSNINKEFTAIITGNEPEEYDLAYIGSGFDYENSSFSSLPLMMIEYEKDMFKTRFDSSGKLSIQLKNINRNYFQDFYNFKMGNLNKYSEEAYRFCIKNKSTIEN